MGAGASVEEVADDYDLSLAVLKAALAYEWDGAAA